MTNTPDKFYQTLLLVNNILVRETTPEGLFSSLGTTLQPLADSDRCSLSIYDTASDTVQWFAQAEGLYITPMDDKNNPLRGPLAHTAIKTRQPYVVKDLRELAESKAIQHMLDAGLQSAIALPLLSRSEAIGALVLSYSRQLSDEDHKLILLLEKIAVQVSLAVDNMLAHAKLKQMNTELTNRVGSLLYPEKSLYAEQRFFCHCDAMHQVLEQAVKLAHSDVPVLIQGETGTGKEFIAHYIHQQSVRHGNNFVKVNCPALSSTLFESELFGHAKGAFTGASSQRTGRFEMAHKGSIFLDEIGELEKPLQAKLLQVLQDASFERVGESRSIHVDVRFISATNADLASFMNAGLFRRDLYYRLGATLIHVPPLRERPGELLPLLSHLVTMFSKDMHCAPVELDAQASQIMLSYDWPGNVRELSNLVKRLLIMRSGCVVSADFVASLLQERNTAPTAQSRLFSLTPAPHARLSGMSPTPFEDQKLHTPERQSIEQALTMTNGVVSGKKGAATLLGIPRSTLLYKLHKYGLNPSQFIRQSADLHALHGHHKENTEYS